MAHYGAPAISVAYAEGGEIIWAEGYGEGVDADTLFQAASLSKAVAAAGIVSYALKTDIDLDADVFPYLPGVDAAAMNPDGHSVSLRGLLSHTAGATVGGFPGYALGAPVPTNPQVVAGAPPANTPPVRIEPDANRPFRYSGGGFQIAQAVVEAHSGEPFETTMAREVLEPVGMPLSSFELKPAGGPTDGIAVATLSDGVAVEGGWHMYPEQAAAGLWTTPREYLRFMTALMAAKAGEVDRGVAPEAAEAVLTSVSEGYGLGVGVLNEEGRLQYRHGGSNRGYRCFAAGFPDTGQAFIVMTSSEDGQNIAMEVLRAAAATYGWPGQPPKTVTRVKLSDAALAAFVGDYALPGSEVAYLTLSAADGVLKGDIIERGDFELVPIGETRFIDPDDGEEIEFRVVDGRMVLESSGTVLPRL